MLMNVIGTTLVIMPSDFSSVPSRARARERGRLWSGAPGPTSFNLLVGEGVRRGYSIVPVPLPVPTIVTTRVVVTSRISSTSSSSDAETASRPAEYQPIAALARGKFVRLRSTRGPWGSALTRLRGAAS
jgi:hypothetical protein